jgi:hypothetical protein
MASLAKVPRPQKKTPYTLPFATKSAQKGWREVLADRPADLGKAWDALSHTPLDMTPHSYPLKGEFQTVTRKGMTYERWQLKPSLSAGIRVWCFVSGDRVYLKQVHTHHPNKTK